MTEATGQQVTTQRTHGHEITPALHLVDEAKDQDDRDIGLCAVGDLRGLEALYARHARSCLALARRLLRDDRQHAEDVVQEAFLRLWRHAHRYDGQRATPQSWLMMLTYRKAVDRVRLEQPRRTDTWTGRPTPNDLTRGPEVRALLNLDDLRVVRALQELPPAQAKVVVLTCWGGLTEPEIAASLGLPLGTVQTRAGAGLRTLALSCPGHFG